MSAEPKRLTEAEIRDLESTFEDWTSALVLLDDDSPLVHAVARIVAAREAAARREALLEAEGRVSKAEDELRRVKAASLYADGHMQVIVDMDRRYDRLRAHADQTEQELDKARARVEEYAAIKAHLAASIHSEKAASAKVARVEALVEEWEQPGWVPTGIWVTRLIRAALAEPERDEEDGR